VGLLVGGVWIALVVMVGVVIVVNGWEPFVKIAIYAFEQLFR